MKHKVVDPSKVKHKQQIGNGLHVGTSRDRIEFPRNAIRVKEADVLVMGLWILLNPMVEYPCRVSIPLQVF